MNVLDIVMAIPILFLLYRGWKRGLVREVASLVGVVAGVWAAVNLSEWVAEAIGLEGESAAIIALFVTFVCALLLAYLLGKCVEGLLKAAKLGVANRVVGALLGTAKAVCLVSVLLSYITMVDRKEMVLKPKVKAESMLYRPVYVTGSKMTASIERYVAEHKKDWEEKL